MTIESQTLSYTAGEDELKGYMAYDDKSGSTRPGVIVVHEWWGLDDYIRTRADKLAELGYAALAIDMYGNGATADSPDEAGAMMNAVLGNMEIGTSRLRAAHEVLCAQPVVDETRTAAIGYCFGGAMVLHMLELACRLKQWSVSMVRWGHSMSQNQERLNLEFWFVTVLKTAWFRIAI